MQRYCFYCLAMLLLLVSCKSKKAPSILTASNLPSTFITLSADSAYTLKTPKGAIIRIAKNSFDVPANTKVTVEIKEAYSLNDILLAGLSTTSDGKLLQSGGMIYFNASVNGQDAKIINPIHISIPTTSYNTNMQLFKGDVKPDDSTINWTDPQPLDSSAKAKELNMGNALFNQNCKNCHKPTMDFTGPALAHCRDREPNKDWAYQFIDHVNIMVQSDPYAIGLMHKYGSVMQQQNLTKDEIKAILDYCDNNVSVTDSATGGFCGYDTSYIPMPDTTIQIVPEDTTSINDTTTTTIPPAAYIPADVPLYNFSIDQSGWYNIDCFIDANINSVSTVHLSAVINNMPDSVDNLSVYLAVPSRKLLSDQRGQKGNTYTFYDQDNDSIRLISNDDAFIFAIGTLDGKVFYGIAKFTIKDQQSIVVNALESTRENVTRSLIYNKLDKTKIDPLEPEIDSVVNRQPVDYDSTRNDTTRQPMQMIITPSDCRMHRSAVFAEY